MSEYTVRLDDLGEGPGAGALLRIERRLAHPPDKVWRVVTEPAEMAHWFPALVQAEPAAGAPMRFTLPEGAPDGLEGGTGEVLEYDPPKVYAFRWDDDVLRFELLPEGSGTRLLFSQTLSGRLGRLSAGHTAHGWTTCLDGLLARLAGEPAPNPANGLLGPVTGHLERFGLDRGAAVAGPDGVRLEFVRDLVWRPAAEAWAALTGGTEPAVGDLPPAAATADGGEAGTVTAIEAPRLLEFEWLRDGAVAGTVRWEILTDPGRGIRAELAVTGSVATERAALLTAWHLAVHRYFAAVLGEPAEPGPDVDALSRDYARRPA